jgi:outer membrane protein OmpA-like peptidoglycan-associated protein
MAAPIKAENKGVFFEIEGHTDSTGPEEYNVKLGEERAMAVRNYLAMTHGIALSRISVISYGSSKPVTDNKTRDNRAQNRRVVVRVVE